MRKVLVGIFLLLAFGLLFYIFNSRVVTPLSQKPNTEQTAVSPTPTEQTARFLIFTSGTMRVFTDPKYHNRHEDVYITANDPSVIIIKKPGATWGDFFNSLPAPMKVTDDCLMTGTGQEFCTNEMASLSCYLNGEKVTGVLTEEIKPLDRLLISFGNGTLIDEQLEAF